MTVKMLELNHPHKKKAHKYGTEVIIPEESPLIGMKLIDLEQTLDIKVHHYHAYRITRQGYSHRIFENIGEHKLEARDMIKYFAKDIFYIGKIDEEIASGGGLNQLSFIVQSQSIKMQFRSRQNPSSKV
jgi:hypothetical protein